MQASSLEHLVLDCVKIPFFPLDKIVIFYTEEPRKTKQETSVWSRTGTGQEHGSPQIHTFKYIQSEWG